MWKKTWQKNSHHVGSLEILALHLHFDKATICWAGKKWHSSGRFTHIGLTTLSIIKQETRGWVQSWFSFNRRMMHCPPPNKLWTILPKQWWMGTFLTQDLKKIQTTNQCFDIRDTLQNIQNGGRSKDLLFKTLFGCVWRWFPGNPQRSAD